MLKILITMISSITIFICVLLIVKEEKIPRIVGQTQATYGTSTDTFYWQVASRRAHFVLACEDPLRHLIGNATETSYRRMTKIIFSMDDYFEAPVVLSCRAQTTRGSYSFRLTDLVYVANYNQKEGRVQIDESKVQIFSSNRDFENLQDGQYIDFFLPLQVERSTCTDSPFEIYYRGIGLSIILRQYLGFGCE